MNIVKNMPNSIRNIVSSLFILNKKHVLKIPNLSSKLSMKVHETTDVHISASIAESGIWEPIETQFIINTLRPGDNFVDVGANIGYFSVIASKIVGAEGKVFAFEPDDKNYSLLSENCKINSCNNIKLFKAALSDKTEKGILYLNEENKGDHTIFPTKEVRSNSSISLLNGFDIFLSKKQTIDFLKIDTQGSEFQVVKGLLSSIQFSLPNLIMIIELSPNSLKVAGHSGHELLDLFTAFNGYFYHIINNQSDLASISINSLKEWVSFVEGTPSSEGFINLIFSGTPLEEQDNCCVIEDLGLFDDSLQYLFGRDLRHWDGSARVMPEIQKYIYFSSGWSFPESWGIWSKNKKSFIKFYITENIQILKNPMLFITGQYFGEEEETEVYLNESYLGKYNLKNATIPLTNNHVCCEHITIKFIHNKPVRPSDISDSSKDVRELKFGLISISIH